MPPESPGRHTQRRTIGIFFVAILLLVAAIVGFKAHHLAQHRISLGIPAYGDLGYPINDFDRFLALQRRIVHEGFGYADDGFPNPPLMLVAFAPFAQLSNPVAEFLWAICKPAFALAILLLGLAMVRRAGARIHPLALAILLFAWFWPWVGEVQQGQTNLFMLLPLVAGLSLAQKYDAPDSASPSTRRWAAGAALLAGILVGLAVCIKLTPLVFLAYFLWRRRWLVSAGIAAGILLGLFIIPSLFLGPARNLDLLRQWNQVIILPYLTTGRVDYMDTQSLASFFKRLLSHSPAFDIAGVNQYVNIAWFSSAAVVWICRGTLLLSVLAGCFWCRRPLARLASPRYIIEIGCVAAFMLCASERTWVHHYVTVILPLLAAAMVVCDESLPFNTRAALWTALWTMAAGMLLTSDFGKILGKDGPLWMRAFGVCVVTMTFMVAMTLWTFIQTDIPAHRNPAHA